MLPRLKLVIFVHGCFWHRHKNCRYTTTPKTRVEFWQKKFEQNVERDRRNIAELRRVGWRVYCIWECQTRDKKGLERRLRHLLADTEERMHK